MKYNATAMEQGNQKKIKDQLIEMESFFTGDFTIRKKKQAEEAPTSSTAKKTVSIENDSLDRIAREVEQCRKCEIGHTRTHGVPGEGDPNARLVFIGEAPGADEDAQGRPFVGRAGQLLEKMIAAMGLRREDVFITNVIKSRPPGNRDPKVEEIDNCWPYLRRQLELIEPEIIVALGSHAARTLLKTDRPIGQLRGHFHEFRFSETKAPSKLMPTYHPAYLLRNYTPEARKKVWDDLQKVMKELGLKAPKGSKIG